MYRMYRIDVLRMHKNCRPTEIAVKLICHFFVFFSGFCQPQSQLDLLVLGLGLGLGDWDKGSTIESLKDLWAEAKLLTDGH